jgi:Zn-finger nucleic acid-binding protein
MFCPSCYDPMVILEFEEIETDYCTKCGGIWLDDGELDLLIENSEKKHELLNSFSEAHVVEEKKIRCPICNKKMIKTFVGADKDVVIDECKYKHGLWFDTGEILKVVKKGSVNKEDSLINFLEDMYKNKINEQ